MGGDVTIQTSLKPHNVVWLGVAENRPAGCVGRNCPYNLPSDAPLKPRSPNSEDPRRDAHLGAQSGRQTRHRAAPSAVPSAAALPPRDPATVVRSRPTPAMLLSVGFHGVLLLILGWTVSVAPQGTGAAPDRQIGIAMVHRLPERDRYEEVTPQTSDPVESQSDIESAAAAAASPPADLSPPIDLQGVLAAIEATPAPTSGSGIAGDQQLDGDAFGDGAGSKPTAPVGERGTARLFGVSGSGSRFVYVMDRSDSMNGYGGAPLRSAKRELIRSLNSLSPHQEFQIIFYNDSVKPFQLAGTPLTMVRGETDTLRRAQDYIDSIRAFGGTKHQGALLMALRMSPDVIFFLTDAHIPRLSRIELATIQDRAQRSGTTIHAIEFGSQPAGSPDSFLRELAAMNNGQYQYVDVRRLAESNPTGGDAEAAESP